MGKLIKVEGFDACFEKIEELKISAKQLEELIGSLNSEQILDQLFSRFCIGK